MSKKNKNKYDKIFDDDGLDIESKPKELEKNIDKDKDEIKTDTINIDDFTPKTTFGKIINYMLLATTFVSTICLFIYTFIKSSDDVNRMFSIISVGILMVFTLFFMIESLLIDNKRGRFLTSISSILLISYSVFTITTDMGYLKLPTQDYVPNFTGKNLTEVVKWASSNNVELNQVYETSDLVEEYKIISQDIDTYTLVKNIESLTVVVSEGPNYDKEIVLPSFIGRDIESLVKFINDNYLSNVNIDFIFSNTERETILTQDKSGQIKRNDNINFTASLGLEDMLEDVKMIDLSNKSLFEATLFLKRYGIKYELIYDYSENVKKDYVITQDKDIDTLLNYKNDKVTLTISKGPKITVIDLTNKTVDEITKWVVENNLKIEFSEEYDDTVEMGNVISVNVKEKDTIEEGKLISVIISKGHLRMESFKTAAEFRAWAEKYEITYKEEYEFNDSVSSGNIISSSHKEGDIIKNTDIVIIHVSQGKSVTIPNLVGMSKSDIQSKCKSIGLTCTFKYGSYSDSVGKDVATNQNKKAGSVVSQGTSIQITLSLGKAKSYNVVIQSNWLSAGNADNTISTLKQKLQSACPNVTFKFVKKTVNSGVGLITPDSPTKGGNNTFVEGKTYTFYIGS